MLEKLYNLKLNNNDKIVLLESGIFYYVFIEDAYIISYLCKYKIINYKDKDSVCFPKTVLNKVLKLLKKEEIGFIINDEINYGDSKKYYDLYLKSLNYVNKIKCLDLILTNIDNISLEQLNSIL